MDKSLQFAEALIKDYSNYDIRNRIEKTKIDSWKDANAYWIKILTNQMHIGSNSRVLLNRIALDEFKAASNFEFFSKLDKDSQKELLGKFVPGGRRVSSDTKTRRLIDAVDLIILKGGIKSIFGSKLSKKEVINILMLIDGIGHKQARNIPMDLYHPAFRNGSIPVDQNWKKVAKHLGFKWSKSEKHEQDIIEWRDKYIDRKIIKDDWDFDRLIYIVLNDSTSHTHKFIRN